ncbi:putative ribonuclease H-like domain-containing protein [Tanacetum coccineum]
MAFVSSPSSTNEVSIANTQVSLLALKLALLVIKGPRNQDSRNRNQDSSRRTINVEEISSKAMMAIDGAVLNEDIWSQITDKSRKGVGFVSYNAVPPPPTRLFSPLNLDLSYSGLEEFQQPKFEGYGPKTSKSVSEDISNEVRESPDAPLVKELVSDDKLTAITIKGKGCARPKAINTARPNSAVVNAVRANQVNAVKASACWVWRPTKLNSASITLKRHNYVDGHPQKEDQGYVDSGCSRHMTGNMSYLSDFKEFDGGYLADESQVLLKVPRKNNMYSVDMKNIVPKESLTCLVAKATLDESMLWHRRLGHVNFKTINKLVKENLVRGLPSKHFENDQTCVACLKGKQHKASCKSKIQNSITQPLFMLHMDLFGPTFVSSLMNKKYCLVVTDDYSRFTWVFFLASKDETSGILKSFITEIENLVDKKVKIIRCDNGTEFKNRERYLRKGRTNEAKRQNQRGNEKAEKDKVKVQAQA